MERWRGGRIGGRYLSKFAIVHQTVKKYLPSRNNYMSSLPSELNKASQSQRPSENLYTIFYQTTNLTLFQKPLLHVFYMAELILISNDSRGIIHCE